MFISSGYCLSLIESKDAAAVAAQLEDDSATCDREEKPSSLWKWLPPADSAFADQISKHLTPCRLASPPLSEDLRTMVYESVYEKLKSYFTLNENLGWPTQSPRYLEGPREAAPAWKNDSLSGSTEQDAQYRAVLAELGTDGMANADPTSVPASPRNLEAPSEEEFRTALKVLQHMAQSSSVMEACQSLQAEITLRLDQGSGRETLKKNPKHSASASQPSQPNWKHVIGRFRAERPRRVRRACYICRRNIVQDAHPVNACMCRPCGEFNLAGSVISLPENLSLDGRTAVVTGARVNLGYATALRLLRCGAKVVVSSRYPWDAHVRYSKERDFDSWSDRLKIAGADFRTAEDAFQLASQVKKQIREWGGTLDILINNAAQTLTDSIRQEDSAVKKETILAEASANNSKLLLPDGGYRARIRGGATKMLASGFAEPTKPLRDGDTLANTSVLEGSSDGLTPYNPSSWVQSLSEIPYEDLISAFSVNTFVPMILCRELLPLMGSSTGTHKSSKRLPSVSQTPRGYIVNVSSREGIFESVGGHSAKRGRHVHTNMSKAAMNMIVETEAEIAWETRRVAMNNVDPGYMSAAPEMVEKYGPDLPLGWEDGAGRVLWPIAIGEREKMAVWGKFLKHYGQAQAETGQADREAE